MFSSSCRLRDACSGTCAQGQPITKQTRSSLELHHGAVRRVCAYASRLHAAGCHGVCQVSAAPFLDDEMWTGDNPKAFCCCSVELYYPWLPLPRITRFCLLFCALVVRELYTSWSHNTAVIHIYPPFGSCGIRLRYMVRHTLDDSCVVACLWILMRILFYFCT